MNSSVKLDAVRAQFKPLLFHGKVPMYPVLQTFVISISHIQGGVVKIRNKLRRGAWLMEHLLSDRPSVIRHLRLSCASLLDPADNIRNEVSSRTRTTSRHTTCQGRLNLHRCQERGNLTTGCTCQGRLNLHRHMQT